MLPCSRYRTPPCASFVLRLDVPLPKSLCSSSRVSYPRLAASMATPTPVAPPPTTIMSQGLLCARTRRHISSRVMMEKSRKAFSNDSYPFDDEGGQGCAEQRTNDRDRRVSPIGAA